eukprot:11449285-Alexandrium_andersonii.AAC.1
MYAASRKPGNCVGSSRCVSGSVLVVAVWCFKLRTELQQPASSAVHITHHAPIPESETGTDRPTGRQNSPAAHY